MTEIETKDIILKLYQINTLLEIEYYGVRIIGVIIMFQTFFLKYYNRASTRYYKIIIT